MAQRLKTDWTLFSTLLILVAFGLVVVYSASSVIAQLKHGYSTYYFWRQAGWAVVSFGVLMLLKRMDYRQLRQPLFAFAALGVTLMLLVGAYFADHNAHRWIRFGGFGLQPSELAKPALTLFLAYFIATKLPVLNEKRTLLQVGLALGVLAGLVVLGDLGTAMVLILTSAAVFFVAGLERRYFILGMIAVTLFAGVAIVSKPYRLSRVIGFVDPEYTLLDQIDPAGHIKKYSQRTLTTRDTGYQARQSKIAVGAGGVTGAGLMQGRQKLLYLPEAHTDFVYAVVGEELGLGGCMAVIIGFGIILWRGFRLFQLVPDDFGRYLALGVTASILIQALINMSVVLDLGPTKGIPLPMISYGGSSLLSTLTSLGLLLSVSEHAG